MTTDWTPAELAALEREAPDWTGRAPDGALYATVTKEEAARLLQRFPSMFAEPAGPSGDVLRARYPTMYEKKR